MYLAQNLFEEAKTDSENIDGMVIVFAGCPMIASQVLIDVAFITS